jgi:hypothetical protein
LEILSLDSKRGGGKLICHHHLRRELGTAEMLKGKRKNQWNDSSTVEEDQLKVTHYNIFVCGVRTLYGLLYWSSHRNVIDCTVYVCSSYCKTAHILNFNIRVR